MKEISMVEGGVALVDDEDYDELAKWEWHNKSGYAVRFWIVDKSRTKTIQMHSEILLEKSGHVIDHIDGNRANNTRGNLRFATRSQSSTNTKTRSKSGYRGVYGIHGGWHVHIGKQRTDVQ